MDIKDLLYSIVDINVKLYYKDLDFRSERSCEEDEYEKNKLMNGIPEVWNTWMRLCLEKRIIQ